MLGISKRAYSNLQYKDSKDDTPNIKLLEYFKTASVSGTMCLETSMSPSRESEAIMKMKVKLHEKSLEENRFSSQRRGLGRRPKLSRAANFRENVHKKSNHFTPSPQHFVEPAENNSEYFKVVNSR